MSRSAKKFPGRNRRNWNQIPEETYCTLASGSGNLRSRRRTFSNAIGDPSHVAEDMDVVADGLVQFRALQLPSTEDFDLAGYSDENLENAAIKAEQRRAIIQQELEQLMEPEINVIQACNERAEAKTSAAASAAQNVRGSKSKGKKGDAWVEVSSPSPPPGPGSGALAFISRSAYMTSTAPPNESQSFTL